MRMVSRVNASTCTSANALFTIMAFVEKRMEPKNAMINPTKGKAFFLDFASIDYY